MASPGAGEVPVRVAETMINARTTNTHDHARRGQHSEALVELLYGRGSLPFRFDPDRFTVLASDGRAEIHLDNATLAAAIDAPIGSKRLEEIVRPSDRVVLVVPDATRVAGVERVTRLVLDRLAAAGVADERISVLVGGGIHRAPMEAEIRRILGEELATRLAVFHHDATDPDECALIGETTRGTPVELNRRLLEADRVVAVGAITFHYFAGFSAGRKAILPGCASERSICANHLLAFDPKTLGRAAGVASALLEGNPVHEDMEEAVSLLPPSFLVNTAMTSANEIGAAYAGDWRLAHRRGCEEYLVAHAVAFDGKLPLVVVSCGGAPRDVNMIQAHKAMEHASTVLEDGGTMVVLAECAEGLGRVDFLDWFVPGGARATALKLISGDYRVNGQTAWGIRWKAERYSVRLISSLEPAVVRAMGLEPSTSIIEALAGTGDARGYVLPLGSTNLPRPAAPAVG
jgi:nickel-dependent lactate racemase